MAEQAHMGDNLLVIGSLLKKFAGKIDLIYIDPPFATGADFSIGHQQVAYRDTWRLGTGGYLAMMAERLRLMRDLLSPAGRLISALRLACESPAASDR